MSEGERWVPQDVDVNTASVARMYDYFLGGGHNFAVDREAAQRAVAILPQIVSAARANREFLQRAVRLCLELGVRQFLDLGSGIPTVGHVHEVARAVDPAVRVAYVDTDPVAVAHTHLLLDGLDSVSITRADLTDPQAVLSAPDVAGLLDFTRPVAVIAAAVLHFVADERDPRGILDAYRDAVVPGSLLVCSHGADAYDRPERLDAIRDLYERTSHPGQRRTHPQVAELLGGWELLDPGLVDANAWRPSEPTLVPDQARIWVTVARRPELA